MTDYSPDPIPGLEAEHRAEVRPGPVAPEHDRPAPVDVDMLGIRAAIYRYRHHIRSFHDAGEPPGPELHAELVLAHAILSGGDTALRGQIEALIPALRDRDRGPTDTQRLDWLMERPGLARYEITREKIDVEMALESALESKKTDHLGARP